MNYASASAALRGTPPIWPKVISKLQFLGMIFFALSEWESAQFISFIALQQIFKNRANFEQPSHFLMKSGINWADKWKRDSMAGF